MRYGLIGGGLTHSYSKLIHEKIADYTYELIPLNKEEFHLFMEKREFAAINVTIPYKKAVLPYLDHLHKDAAAIGAVNTIVNKNGYLTGYNTDYAGFLYMIKKNDIRVAGKKVLILGTGGASLAVSAVIKGLNAAEILSVSRNSAKGISYEAAKQEHQDTQIIINTTPVGMYPHVEESPIDLSCFPQCQAVLDIVYNPAETKLTAQAKSLGMKGITGLSMLVAQAKYAIELFLDDKLNDNLIGITISALEKELNQP